MSRVVEAGGAGNSRISRTPRIPKNPRLPRNPSDPSDPSDPRDRWPLVRLGDVCEVVLGGTPSTQNAEYWGGGIPWLTPGEMRAIHGRYVEHTERTLTEAGLEAGSRLFPARSVVLSTRAPIGYVFINTVPMATNQGCKTLVPSTALLPEYLYYNLLGRTVELNALGTGTTFKELATGAIKNLTLPLPPLATQRAIVARLDSALARAGGLEERFVAIAQNAELSFKAMLAEEFGEAREAGAAREVGVAGVPRFPKNPRNPSDPRDPRNPSDPSPQWPMVRLGDVCEHFQYGTAQKSTPTGLVPVLRMGNLQDGRIDFSDLVYTSNEEDIKEYALQDGDLLFNRTNSSDKVGKVAIFHGQRNCIFAGYLVRFRPMGFDPDYVCYAMNTDDYRNWCRSVKKDAVNQSNISASKLANFALACPPLSVQRAIVSRLDAARKRADGIATLARQAAEVAANLKKALLKEAFE